MWCEIRRFILFLFFYSKGMWNRFKINFILSFETAWFDTVKILPFCPTLLLRSLWTIQRWHISTPFLHSRTPYHQSIFSLMTLLKTFFAIIFLKTFGFLLLSAGLKEILTSCSADNRLAMMKIKKGEWSGVEWVLTTAEINCTARFAYFIFIGIGVSKFS